MAPRRHAARVDAWRKMDALSPNGGRGFDRKFLRPRSPRAGKRRVATGPRNESRRTPLAGRALLFAEQRLREMLDRGLSKSAAIGRRLPSRSAIIESMLAPRTASGRRVQRNCPGCRCGLCRATPARSPELRLHAVIGRSDVLMRGCWGCGHAGSILEVDFAVGVERQTRHRHERCRDHVGRQSSREFLRQFVRRRRPTIARLKPGDEPLIAIQNAVSARRIRRPRVARAWPTRSLPARCESRAI